MFAVLTCFMGSSCRYGRWGYMLYNTVEPATSSLWELWNSPTEGPGGYLKSFCVYYWH